MAFEGCWGRLFWSFCGCSFDRDCHHNKPASRVQLANWTWFSDFPYALNSEVKFICLSIAFFNGSGDFSHCRRIWVYAPLVLKPWSTGRIYSGHNTIKRKNRSKITSCSFNYKFKSATITSWLNSWVCNSQLASDEFCLLALARVSYTARNLYIHLKYLQTSVSSSNCINNWCQ